MTVLPASSVSRPVYASHRVLETEFAVEALRRPVAFEVGARIQRQRAGAQLALRFQRQRGLVEAVPRLVVKTQLVQRAVLVEPEVLLLEFDVAAELEGLFLELGSVEGEILRPCGAGGEEEGDAAARARGINLLAQVFDAGQVIQREHFIREVAFLDLGIEHHRLVALEQRAVGLDGCRPTDAAAEILDVLEIKRLDQQTARGVGLDLGRQHQFAVDPHFQLVVGDFVAAGFQREDVGILLLLDTFCGVLLGVVEAQDGRHC
jgi:hypothetical protein